MQILIWVQFLAKKNNLNESVEFLEKASSINPNNETILIT